MRRPPYVCCVWLSFVAPLACSSRSGNTPSADVPSSDLFVDAAPSDAQRADGSISTDRPQPVDGSCPVNPVPMGTSRAGAMCTSDSQCGARLECDTDFVSGFCTATCVNNPSQACEAAQCGGNGSTCLTIGDGAQAMSSCTATCNPTARTGQPGACRAGTVCTGWWYTRESAEPDRTGCEYFCQSDAQCVTGSRCNPRIGECGMTGLVMARRADGEPCDPMLDKMTPQCRGICFEETDNPREGICGSLVNMAVTPDCPDTPARIRAIAPSDDNGRTDNLGLCIYRECMTHADCTAPLRCVPGEDGDPPTCSYPDPSMRGDAGVATDASRRDVPAGS